MTSHLIIDLHFCLPSFKLSSVSCVKPDWDKIILIKLCILGRQGLYELIKFKLFPGCLLIYIFCAEQFYLPRKTTLLTSHSLVSEDENDISC